MVTAVSGVERGGEEKNDTDAAAPNSRRWIILGLVSVTFLTRSYGITCFAAVNDVTSDYFRIEPVETDLLSTIIFAAKAIACVVIAILSGKLTLRHLTMAATGAVAIGNTLVATAIYERTSYPVAMIGQGFSGLAAAALNTVPALVSVLWFPATENGLAFSIPWAASRMSLALSGILSTHTFNISRITKNEVSLNETLRTEEIHEFTDSTLSSFRRTFLITFFTLAGIAITVHILTTIFVTSGRPSESKACSEYEEWSMGKELKAIFGLFKQGNFVALTLTNLLLLSIKPMVTVLLSSLVLKRFPHLDDRTPGQIFFVASLIGALGGLAAGCALDRFKQLKITSLVGSIILLISCCLVVCAFYIRLVIMLYFAFTFVVFFREFTFVSITKLLLSNVSSANKLRLTSVFMTIPLTAVMGYAYAMRALLNHNLLLLASAFPIPFICLVILLVSCVKTTSLHDEIPESVETK